MDLAGFEPATFRMQSGRAAVALQALLYSDLIGLPDGSHPYLEICTDKI